MGISRNQRVTAQDIPLYGGEKQVLLQVLLQILLQVPLQVLLQVLLQVADSARFARSASIVPIGSRRSVS